MTQRRFCRNRLKATDHRHVRVNAFGDRDEGAVSRAFSGVISFGISELFSEHKYECLECGRLA